MKKKKYNEAYINTDYIRMIMQIISQLTHKYFFYILIL